VRVQLPYARLQAFVEVGAGLDDAQHLGLVADLALVDVDRTHLLDDVDARAQPLADQRVGHRGGALLVGRGDVDLDRLCHASQLTARPVLTTPGRYWISG